MLAAYREISRHGRSLDDAVSGPQPFEMIDGEGRSHWTFGDDGSVMPPFVIRTRAVTDGVRRFNVTSWLCDSADADVCERAEDRVRSAPAQAKQPRFPRLEPEEIAEAAVVGALRQYCHGTLYRALPGQGRRMVLLTPWCALSEEAGRAFAAEAGQRIPAEYEAKLMADQAPPPPLPVEPEVFHD